MSDIAQTKQRDKSAPLVRGLARNTVFNILGWAWPALLALVSVPYIVTGLGNDVYGIFGIIMIVTGYLGLINGPFATGNVQLMAEAYGCQDWKGFQGAAFSGLLVVGVLASIGAGVMFVSAYALAADVFKVPTSLLSNTVVAFRIGAISFFLNGIASSLRGIPMAIRRYDALNAINLVVGTLNTAGIIVAIWLGWGLIGAVWAQTLSSFLAVICFAALALRVISKSPISVQGFRVERRMMKRLFSFSSILFLSNMLGSTGTQIDRTIVGIFLGPAALTFYIVPAKITDRIPDFMGSFSGTLYPLSAEAQRTDRLDELRHLYLYIEKWLLWISGIPTVLLVVLSRDILTLWISPEMAEESHWVLVFLALSAMSRAPGSIAYQVCIGMGRADIPLWSGVFSIGMFTLSTLAFIKPFGLAGVAFGMLIVMMTFSIGFDLYTQRILLKQKDWLTTLKLYLRSLLAIIATVVCVWPLLSKFGIAVNTLMIKGSLVGITYFGFSILFGALRVRDIQRLIARFRIQQPGP